ncbi:MAG: protein kinase [Myxococcota bacterium]
MTKLQRGERLGDWVVDRPLGAGGMGSVYRCHSVLAEDVVAAVKVLDRRESTDFERRFVQELRTLSNLNHPAIVRVLGGGRHETEGFLYLAMELIDGEDLHTRLGRGPLNVPEALAVFGPVSDALDYAHASGVAHRDIKPANVMIRSDGRPVIVDFGIAVSSGATRHTQDGTLPGTMAYLPPEAFAGVLPDPKATDAYALGVVLWESITGEEPFAADPTSTMGQQLAQIMGQKLQSEALDPGDPIPPPVREAIRRTTDPEPASRLIDLAKVRALLEDAAGRTYTLDLPPLRPPAKPPAKRRRSWGRRLLQALLVMLSLAAVGVAITLVALLGVAGVLWSLSPVAPTLEPLRPPVDLATSLAAGADALEAGQLNTALEEAQHALDDHPEDPHANLLYGQVLLATNAGPQARPFLCAALAGGLSASVPASNRPDCERGPGASAPLVAKLAIATLDQSNAIAAIDGKGADAVASVDEDVIDEPSMGASPGSAARPSAVAAAPAPARRDVASAPLESAAMEEAVATEKAVAAPASSGAPQAPKKDSTARARAGKRTASAGPKLASVTVTGGDATAGQAVRRVLQQADTSLRSCSTSASGTLDLTLNIDANGTVLSISARRRGGLDAATEACMIRRLKALTFPAGAGIKIVRASYTF